MTFYGIARARREGWDLRHYPGRLHIPGESDEKLAAFRARGAVVVGIIRQRHAGEVTERSYVLGLPPAGMDVDLRALAGPAGMMGDQPETLGWKGGV